MLVFNTFLTTKDFSIKYNKKHNTKKKAKPVAVTNRSKLTKNYKKKTINFKGIRQLGNKWAFLM